MPKLAIGPLNTAGQAFCWAEAVAGRLGVPAISYSSRRQLMGLPRSVDAFDFPVHLQLPHHRLAALPFVWRFRARAVIGGVSHLAIESFAPPFSRMDRPWLLRDVDYLAERDVQIALIAHGSDFRDPDRHMENFPWSYYAEADPDWVASLRASSRRNRRLVAELGLPLFVSTPDQLIDAPSATWLPVCVDVEAWVSDRPALVADAPVVVHIPSRRNPPIKGTVDIDPVLRDLCASGRIRYVSPNSAPHRSMRQLVASADIVVDQVRSGSYGVAAVEGLSAGRLVIGNVSDSTRASMLEEPPIVDAPPDIFRDVMEQVLSDRGSYAKEAAKGPAFARRWHDGRASAAALTPFLREVPGLAVD